MSYELKLIDKETDNIIDYLNKKLDKINKKTDTPEVSHVIITRVFDCLLSRQIRVIQSTEAVNSYKDFIKEMVHIKAEEHLKELKGKLH